MGKSETPRESGRQLVFGATRSERKGEGDTRVVLVNGARSVLAKRTRFSSIHPPGMQLPDASRRPSESKIAALLGVAHAVD